MTPDANKAFVFELGDTLLRSWWTVVAGMCFGLGGAVVALYHIPKTYEASATILISPQQLPEEFFRSTVTEDMTRRMMALEEAQLSGPSMRELVEETFGPQPSEAAIWGLVRRVRNRVSVRPTADIKLGWLSFELTYRDDDPKRTAQVVNRLAEKYIEQNTEFRTQQAQDARAVVEQQLEPAQREFEDVDRRLNEFTALHSMETEDKLDTNMRLQETAKRDLENNGNSRLLNVKRLDELHRELADLGAVTTTAQAQAKLEAEIDDLLSRYSPAHPSVVRKQRQLDELRRAVAEGTTDAGAFKPTDPRVVELQRQISNVQREQTGLEATASQLKRQLQEYERRIDAVAEVQPQMNLLQSEHKRAAERLDDLQKKAARAGESVFIEQSRRGAGMELAERAETPGSPVSPSPQRLYALGLMAGLALFVGPMLARRMLNPPISSESGLRALTSVPVLVTIPRIPTPGNRRAPLRRLAANVGLSMACTAVLAAVVVLYR